MNNTILTVKEVCSRYKINRNLVYEAVQSGELRALKFGRSIRLRECDIMAWGLGCPIEDHGVNVNVRETRPGVRSDS